jgi:hypothetical protein
VATLANSTFIADFEAEIADLVEKTQSFTEARSKKFVGMKDFRDWGLSRGFAPGGFERNAVGADSSVARNNDSGKSAVDEEVAHGESIPSHQRTFQIHKRLRDKLESAKKILDRHKAPWRPRGAESRQSRGNKDAEYLAGTMGTEEVKDDSKPDTTGASEYDKDQLEQIERIKNISNHKLEMMMRHPLSPKAISPTTGVFAIEKQKLLQDLDDTSHIEEELRRLAGFLRVNQHQLTLQVENLILRVLVGNEPSNDDDAEDKNSAVNWNAKLSAGNNSGDKTEPNGSSGNNDVSISTMKKLLKNGSKLDVGDGHELTVRRDLSAWIREGAHNLEKADQSNIEPSIFLEFFYKFRRALLVQNKEEKKSSDRKFLEEYDPSESFEGENRLPAQAANIINRLVAQWSSEDLREFTSCYSELLTCSALCSSLVAHRGGFDKGRSVRDWLQKMEKNAAESEKQLVELKAKDASVVQMNSVSNDLPADGKGETEGKGERKASTELDKTYRSHDILQERLEIEIRKTGAE